MLRFFFRTVGSWGFGKIVSLISPLRKLTLGIALAMWLGILLCIVGIAMLWFYPIGWFGENILDFLGTLISLFTGAVAFTAFKVKNYQDKKIEALSDIGHEKFSEVYASVKERWGKEEEVMDALPDKAEENSKV